MRTEAALEPQARGTIVPDAGGGRETPEGSAGGLQGAKGALRTLAEPLLRPSARVTATDSGSRCHAV